MEMDTQPAYPFNEKEARPECIQHMSHPQRELSEENTSDIEIAKAKSFQLFGFSFLFVFFYR